MVEMQTFLTNKIREFTNTKGSSKNYISGSKIVTVKGKIEIQEEMQSKEIS